MLKAIGKATDSIVFIAQDSAITDSSGGHHGIRFYYSADGCSLVYCKIKYGNATDGDEFSRTLDDYGGGICCTHSSPTIANSTICKNSAQYFGGGIYCSYNSNPVIFNNTITRNYGVFGGAIACVDNSNPTISHNSIRNNLSGNNGGGIYCYAYSNPVISDNIMIENMTRIRRSGGGICCFYRSSPIIINNVISNDTAHNGGGIACFYNSNPIISNNIITWNMVGWRGAGIYCLDSSPLIERNYICENHAGFFGGGIYCYSYFPTISKNVIKRNSAYYGGGGISCDYSTTIISDNLIIENIGGDAGGGILCWRCNANLLNNILVENSSVFGVAIHCYYSNLNILNNTIVMNSADSSGGGLNVHGRCNVKILNTIFWDNSSDEGEDILVRPRRDYSLFIAHTVIDSNKCCFKGSGMVIWGPRNIDDNPLFADTLFHLSASSPCIDAGTKYMYIPAFDTVLLAPRYDFEGGVRPYGGDWDIGADEYGACEIFEQAIFKPQTYRIFAYPNPFNSSCFIKVPADAKIEIYDLKGNIIKKFGSALANELIVREQIYDSNQLYIWTPGRSVSSGIYLIRAMVGDRIMTKRIVFIK